MHKYSTISELIDALDAYWEHNDTYKLRYEHDTENGPFIIVLELAPQ